MDTAPETDTRDRSEGHNGPSEPLNPPPGSQTPETAPEAATREVSGTHGATETEANPAPRPWTPDRRNDDGSTTIKMKRACNGCGTRLGDVTDQEMARAIAGLPLPDVRRECPACAPTAPEPVCRPITVIGGDALCVEQDCDHEPDSSGYCDEVQEHAICGTHSEINDDGVIVRAEPWPCKHTTEVTA